jgi:hypothetical protein
MSWRGQPAKFWVTTHDDLIAPNIRGQTLGKCLIPLAPLANLLPCRPW